MITQNELDKIRQQRISDLMPDAILATKKHGFTSISRLQREFRIGYTLAADIFDELKARGIIEQEWDESLPGYKLVEGDK